MTGIRILLIFLVSIHIFGQQNITLTAPAPNPISATSISCSVTGTPGSQTFYYWIVVRYPIGVSFPGGPGIVRNAPNILGGGNSVTVSWIPQPQAISYDLLRTTTNTVPDSGTNSAVAIGLTTTTFIDTFNTLSIYVYSSAKGTSKSLILNNLSYSQPFIEGLDGFLFNPSIPGIPSYLSSRSVLDKLRDTISVKDYGAMGDGINDDSIAIQKAICAAPTNGATILIPKGTYNLITPINFCGKTNLTINLQNGVVTVGPNMLPAAFTIGQTYQIDSDKYTSTPYGSNTTQKIISSNNSSSTRLATNLPSRGNPVHFFVNSPYSASLPVEEFAELDMVYTPPVLFSIANGKLINITIVAGISTVNTSIPHGLVNGNVVTVSGMYPWNTCLFNNSPITVVTPTSFTYVDNGCADAIYTDPGLAITPHTTTAWKTFLWGKVYVPPSVAEGSTILASGTGNYGPLQSYLTPESKPDDLPDYSISARGASERGTSASGFADYVQSGICTYAGGQVGGPVQGYDTWGPWTRANNRLTSIAFNNPTNTATISINIAAFPTTWKGATVIVGHVIIISGATVDVNLNGFYEVLTVTDNTTFTARKVPIPGYTLAATAVYNEATLELSLGDNNGCLSPYASLTSYNQVFNARSHGILVSPPNLTATYFPYLINVNKNLAFSVGRQVQNSKPDNIRFSVLFDGTVNSWRGNTTLTAYPLSGVLTAPNSSTVTAANVGLPTFTTIGTFNVKSEYLEVGRTIRITLYGTYRSLGGTSLQIRLRDSTHIIVGAIANPAINTLGADLGWKAEFNLTVRTVGTAGTTTPNAILFLSGLPGATGSMYVSTATAAGDIAINTTIQQTYIVDVAWGAADPNNSISKENMIVEILN